MVPLLLQEGGRGDITVMSHSSSPNHPPRRNSWLWGWFEIATTQVKRTGGADSCTVSLVSWEPLQPHSYQFGFHGKVAHLLTWPAAPSMLSLEAVVGDCVCVLQTILSYGLLAARNATILMPSPTQWLRFGPWEGILQQFLPHIKGLVLLLSMQLGSLSPPWSTQHPSAVGS